MALTASTMRMNPGDLAPSFALPDIDGKTRRLDDIKGEKATLVVFACNHCPFVIHVSKGLARLGEDYRDQGLRIVAINSNDAGAYPDDHPAKMPAFARQAGWSFPYLHDESQATAKAYGAACTPDFFLFDGELKLAYRGQFDDSRPENGLPVTGEDLRRAIDAVLAGRPAPERQKPSIGCNIKWKPGAEPDYFA